MKKLLLLLLLPLMFACSSDKETEPAIEYIDNNIVAGKWVSVQGAHTKYRIFENNTMRDETWHTYDKDLIGKTNWGVYKLSKEYIYYNKAEVPYILNNDVMTFTYSSGTKETFTKEK